MGGEIKKPFTWIALFRDGHTIEQAEADNGSAAFGELAQYLYGTVLEPKRHYLLWFKLTDGERSFTVSFDRDGDAYITTPDNDMIMTEFKIRSAELLYRLERDRATDQRTYHIGFGGEDTRGIVDSRVLEISDDGSYTLASVLPDECAIINV